MRAVETEQLLGTGPLSDELIEQAAARAMTEVQPIDDWRASAQYRRAMCGVLTRRLLRALRAPSEGET
jgi:carbon-monoxide dehydrogenase medium subunit